jgi:hypothetical protein
LKDSVTQRGNIQLRYTILAVQVKLWWPTEGRTVASGERVGKVGYGTAVEGGVVADRE